MQRPRAPNYTNAMASALNDPPKGKKGSKKKSMRLNSRSPSPFSRYTTEAEQRNMLQELNTSSVDQVNHLNSQIEQFAQQPLTPTDDNQSVETHSQKKIKKDMKHLLESSSIINDIFHERTKKIETEKKAEEDRKAREEEELQEVIEANKSLKDSLLGRGSAGSKMTMAKALSGDMSNGGKSSTKPVDTTKEFLNTIYD